MIKRFFLYGVHMGGDNFAIDLRIELTLPVLPDTAKAEFGRCNCAAVAAEIAGHFMLFKSTVKHGFFHHGLLFGLIDFNEVAFRIFEEEDRSASMIDLHNGHMPIFKVMDIGFLILHFQSPMIVPHCTQVAVIHV